MGYGLLKKKKKEEEKKEKAGRGKRKRRKNRPKVEPLASGTVNQDLTAVSTSPRNGLFAISWSALVR